jgi:ligand-binding sensor domain-containing protein
MSRAKSSLDLTALDKVLVPIVTFCKRLVTLLAIFFFYSSIAPAQELFLKHFTVDEGLPSNELYEITEDSAGYLLIATDRGISKYDGYSFQNIGLRSNSEMTPVYGIFRMPAGNIYFPGSKGHLYLYQNDYITPYKYNSLISAHYKHPGILISNSASEQNDSLWIAPNSNFYYNTDLESIIISGAGRLARISGSPGIYFDLQHKFYYRQLKGIDWNAKQPIYITWEDGTQTIDSAGFFWKGGYIRKLLYEHKGDYNFFSLGRWLFFYKGKNRLWASLFPKNVLSFKVLEGNRIALGFENGGVAICKYSEKGLAQPGRVLLDGLTVTSTYFDRQGGMWISTMEEGLFYSYPTAAVFSGSDSRISFITESGGEVYVGRRSGTIDVYSGGHFRRKSIVPTDDMLYDGAIGEDGHLIVSTGSSCFFQTAMGWQSFKTNDLLIAPYISHQLLTAGTVEPDLKIYSLDNKKLLNAYSLPKRIISLDTDSSGAIWIGTFEGLYTLRQNRLQQLTLPDGTLNDRIISIKKLANGAEAVATLGKGLVVFTKDGTAHFDVSNGLITPTINSMVTDSNTIWLGTNKGLTMIRFVGKQKEIRHYGQNFGLPTLDIHEFAVADGFIYLKWVNRLVIIDVKLLNSLMSSKGPFISYIKNDNRPVRLKNKLAFSHDKNDVIIGFNSIHFASGPNQQFKYRLLGFQDDWQTTNDREVNYTNLPPGNFIFEVRVFDAFGKLVPAAAELHFSITPALWQRWWFPYAAILLLLLAIYALFDTRMRAVKQKNQLMLDLAESEQKALVQLINPHFVFNVLNTAQAAILNDDRMESASILSRFAKLMRQWMELSRKKYVPLRQELELLRQYLELEQIRMPQKFHYNIDILDTVSADEISIPGMLLQPFVENAVKHGIMHLADKKGQLRICLGMEGGVLQCTIKDNGIGREASEDINAATREKHQSSGMDITIGRLKLLHRLNRTKYFYEIVDSKDVAGNPIGTLISFSVPYIENSETT